MRLGCCIPISRYEQIAKDGYDYVEFPAYEIEALTEPEVTALAEKLREYGIPCDRLNAYSLGVPAIVGEHFSQEDTKRYAERLMERAAALHVKSVGIGAPLARKVPEGFDMSKANGQCEDFLRLTGKIAASYGIDILLEAVQKKMCNYMNNTWEALEMVKRLSMENLWLVVDLYHMETMGEDWKDLKNYISWTKHIHVSTVEDGISRGMYGTGDEIYCQRTFDAILKSGYNGSVSIEPDPAALSPEAIKTALLMMRTACKKAEFSTPLSEFYKR